MRRDQVIAFLTKKRACELTKEQRESYIVDWWGIQPNDPEWERLTPALQNELRTRDAPTDPSSEQYDPLLSMAITHRHRGMRNEYLASQARKAGLVLDSIEGEPETLATCPCCLYRTLEAHGEYYICPICFWEDDGSTELDGLSSPNRMTLREGQSNFASFGTCSPKCAAPVRAELRDAYIKATT